MTYLNHLALIAGLIGCSLLAQPSSAQHRLGFQTGQHYIHQSPVGNASVPVWQQIGMINPYRPQRPLQSNVASQYTRPHQTAVPCPCTSLAQPSKLLGQGRATVMNTAPAPRSSVIQADVDGTGNSALGESQSSPSDVAAVEQKRTEEPGDAITALRELLEKSKRDNQALQNVVADLQNEIKNKHIEFKKSRAESNEILAQASEARAMAEAAKRDALNQMRKARAEELEKAKEKTQRMAEQAQRMKRQAEKERQSTLARLKALEQRLKAAQEESQAAHESAKKLKKPGKNKKPPSNKKSEPRRPETKGSEKAKNTNEAPEKKTIRQTPEKQLKRSIDKIKERFKKKMQRVKEEGGDDVQDKLGRLEKTMELQIKKLTERIKNRIKNQRE